MTCILCRVSLPVSSKRRRLHGVSSVGDLALLQQESSKLGVGTIIPPRSAAQGPYLCIVSSAGVLALLQQESSKLGIGTIIPPPPPRSAAQGPYLCIQCFTLAEKVCNARTSPHQLESELHGKIHSAASFHNLLQVTVIIIILL